MLPSQLPNCRWHPVPQYDALAPPLKGKRGREVRKESLCAPRRCRTFTNSNWFRCSSSRTCCRDTCSWRFRRSYRRDWRSRWTASLGWQDVRPGREEDFAVCVVSRGNVYICICYVGSGQGQRKTYDGDAVVKRGVSAQHAMLDSRSRRIMGTGVVKSLE